jgi:hypothetical protein
MARATLREVGERAFTDAAFWKALRKDPESALRSAGIELSPGKLRELKQLLKRNVIEVELDALMDEVHRSQRKAPRTRTWRPWLTWFSWQDR